jgi:hypothetical protein
MNVLRLTAATMILAASVPCLADQSKDRNPAPNDPEAKPGWAIAAQNEVSSIMAQARIVLAALRETGVVSGDPYIKPETVRVADLEGSPVGPSLADGNGSEGCRFMANPGSRIHSLRCYYPSDGEKALNEYQFKDEIRYAIEQQQILEMQRQEAEDMLRTNGRNAGIFLPGN